LSLTLEQVLALRLKRKDLVGKIYSSMVKFILKYYGTEFDSETA
jgi:hypothetical protein